MRSGKILALSAKFLIPLLVLFSFWILLRGHNAPGGGFIGGLIGAVAFSLLLLAFGLKKAKALLPFDPRSLIGIGLLVALGTAILPAYRGQGFFRGLWIQLQIPLLGSFTIGTPQLFDIGVYLVVIGSLMIIIFSLWED